MRFDRFSRRSIFGLASLPWLARPALAASSGSRLPKEASEIWNHTDLYFGASRPNLPMVTDDEFSQFLNDEVTPRFPDGLTLLKGYGQFKNSADIIQREDSRVLILFYPPQTVDANKKIQAIREAYKTKFNQESVLRADSYSVISF